MIGDVTLYRLGEKMFVWSSSRDVDGLYVVNGWHANVTTAATDAELGEVIMQGLAATEANIASLPRDVLQQRWKDLLKNVGIRNYRRDSAGMKATSIHREDDAAEITFTPNSNDGRGFLRPMTDKLLRLSWPTDVEGVGHAARASLDVAR